MTEPRGDAPCCRRRDPGSDASAGEPTTFDHFAQRLSVVLAHAAEAVCIVDAAGRLRYESPAAERLHGLPAAARIGEDGFRLLHPDEIDGLRAKLRALVADPALVVHTECRLRHDQGGWLYVEATVTNHLDDPVLAGIVIIFRDVTERRRTEDALRFLAEAARGLAPADDVDGVLQSVARLAVPTLADCCVVDRIEADGVLRPFAVAHVDPDQEAPVLFAHERYRPPPGEQTVLTLASQTGLAQLAPERDPALAGGRTGPATGDYHGIPATAAMAVPLRVRGRPFGVLVYAMQGSGRRYGPSDLALAEEFGRRVASTIENVQLTRQLTRRIAELTAIQEIARAGNSTLQLDELFRMVVTQINAAFGYRMVSIYLLKDAVLHIQAHVGYEEVLSQIPLGYAVNGRVARTGQAAFVRSAADDPDFVRVRPCADQGIFIPLKTGDGQVLGTLSVESTEQAPLQDEDFAILKLLADQISVAVANARLFEELRQSEQRFRDVATASGEYIWEVGADGLYQYVSDKVTAVLGYRPDHLIGRSPFDFMPHDEITRVRAEHARLTGSDGAYANLEHRSIRRDGQVVWQSVSGIPVRDAHGASAGYRGTALDITERKAAETALKHSAQSDALTGLPNRALLLERLQHAIRFAHRTGRSVALLVMDLDHFKEVNDTFGHFYGDLLLRQIGPRLQGAIRESDTVARLGGDEFAILLPGADEAAATAVARKLLDALAPPVPIAGAGPPRGFEVGASLGIALCPEHGTDADTLLRRADIAMYVAKRGRHGFTVYSVEQDQHSPGRLALLGELRAAIDRDDLVLHFQPQIHLPSGRVTRAEALVRWQHAEFGLMPPAQFVPLAEQTGLMGALTRAVLRASLRASQAWQRAGYDIPVAVNLSTRDVQDPGLPGVVLELLHEAGRAPRDLMLEITETVLMADPDQALTVMADLRGLGVRLSIDDFGTGFSSLAYLKRLPVDEIKIDRSFVRHIADDDNDAAIVRSTIELCHDLGLLATAEGVESEAAWNTLVRLGCDLAQGYYIAPPMALSDVLRWLRDRGA